MKYGFDTEADTRHMLIVPAQNPRHISLVNNLSSMSLFALLADTYIIIVTIFVIYVSYRMSEFCCELRDVVVVADAPRTIPNFFVVTISTSA